jgi:hypothetical protein
LACREDSRGVRQDAGKATQTAREIVAVREMHGDLITKEFARSAANGLTVLESLYARPILAVKEAIEHTELSFPSGNDLIKRFVKQDLLAEITGQARSTLSLHTLYQELFRDRFRESRT